MIPDQRNKNNQKSFFLFKRPSANSRKRCQGYLQETRFFFVPLLTSSPKPCSSFFIFTEIGGKKVFFLLFPGIFLLLQVNCFGPYLTRKEGVSQACGVTLVPPGALIFPTAVSGGGQFQQLVSST